MKDPVSLDEVVQMLYSPHTGELRTPTLAAKADDELVQKCRARNIEIFYLRGEELKRFAEHNKDWPEEEGWYWWSCSPGCLPDGEATGPFPTKRAVCEDALGEDDGF